MKTTRITLFVLAAAVGFGVMAAPASATSPDWSWLSNKNYVSCLKLYANGNFQMPPNLTPAQQAAYHERGRQYCNRTFYGHN